MANDESFREPVVTRPLRFTFDPSQARRLAGDLSSAGDGAAHKPSLARSRATKRTPKVGARGLLKAGRRAR